MSTDTPKIIKTSEDDTMWLLPCSSDDLPNLIQDPYAWLEKQNAKIAANTPEGTVPPLKVLSDYFVISLGVSRAPASVAAAAVSADDYTVEGINGTPVITIRPKHNLAAHPAESEWDAYWDEFSDDSKSPLKAQVEPELGLGYAHFEISQPNDSAEVRAKKVAAFLMYAGDPRRKWAGAGEGVAGEGLSYLNRIHKKVPHSVNSLKPEAAKPVFAQLTDAQIYQINFLYTGTKNDVDVANQRLTALPMDTSSPTACDNHIGTADPNGLITSTDVIIKMYPPPPPVPAP